MNENIGVIIGHVYSKIGEPVEDALIQIGIGSNLRVSGESGKEKDPNYPSTTTKKDGTFVIEFAWDAADIANGEGAPFSLHLWAHTEEFPHNWGLGATTGSGTAWVQGYMIRNVKQLNVFTDLTTISGLAGTLKSLVFAYNKVKFPAFRWLPRQGRMSTEGWMILAGGDVYLNT
jgi:hypothetical protein